MKGLLLYARAVLVLWVLLNLDIPVAFCQDAEHLKKGIVRVQAMAAGGIQRMGTGFIVQQHQDVLYILTATHVIEGAREIYVEFYALRNRQIPAKLVKKEAANPAGLAILEVTERIPPDLLVFRLDSSIPLHENDLVTIIGFPLISNIEWAVTTGRIAGRVAREISFDGPIEKGHSGAPLVKDGKVVGIVTQKRDEFAYATPAIIAEYVLESWGIQQEIPGETQLTRQTDGNLVVNGDFREHWSVGWEKHLSPGDQERGSSVEIHIDNEQLLFKGVCNFCAVSQSIPIDGLKGGLKLQISFSVRACLGIEGECRRGLEGLRYMESYDLAGLQVEYQDKNEEPLGILRFIDTTSGYVVGTGLMGTINASETGGVKSKTTKVGDGWQTLELDLYAEALNTFSFTPEQVKTILIAFFNSSHTEEGEGFGDITVDSVRLYYD